MGKKKRNAVLEFFFPKDFMGEVRRGRMIDTSTYIFAGMDIVKKKGKFWFTFFSWLPIVGSFVFYWEGRKAHKKNEK